MPKKRRPLPDTRPVLVLRARGDGVWSLESSEPCDPAHLILDSGPLSLLLSCIAPEDAEYDRVMHVWAALGNRSAWWCYACGAWGMERSHTSRASRR
jgi:hypothetical protein